MKKKGHKGKSQRRLFVKGGPQRNLPKGCRIPRSKKVVKEDQGGKKAQQIGGGSFGWALIVEMAWILKQTSIRRDVQFWGRGNSRESGGGDHTVRAPNPAVATYGRKILKEHNTKREE